jgi:DNA-binding CsgD family transcriptional regulator
MRALHELGTVDMFDHAGTARLFAARSAADALGALSTGAVIDVHLAAALTFRFELEPAAERARAAVALSERIGLDRVRSLGLMFLAEIHGMARDTVEMERFIAQAAAGAPGDADIEGSGWAGARAMARLLSGDTEGAIADLEHGITIMRGLQGSGPANYRGLWPVLLAATGDRRAGMIIEEERRAGMAVNRGNRGLFALAEAILAGRRGDRARADTLAATGLADLVHYPVWTELALVHVAPAAVADGWGDPVAWLTAAHEVFAGRGYDALAARCTELLAIPAPPAFGLTAREAEVLAGVAQGLANKEIAAALRVSPRTVEKHIEAILRKSGARSRTHLVALAGDATT